MSSRPGHLQCPFCEAYEVERLYLGSLHLDSCTCESCGARWDEDATTGRYRGRVGDRVPRTSSPGATGTGRGLSP